MDKSGDLIANLGRKGSSDHTNVTDIVILS